MNPGSTPERAGAVVNVVVDKTAIAVPDGGSVLQGLRAAGVHVPALCYDDRLAPSGECRTCLVRIKGHERLSTACTTPLVDGMEVETATAELEPAQRDILEMLVSRYPASAIRQFPGKPFHQEILRAGLTESASDCAPDSRLEDRSHPYIAVDMARCITCERCVRICAELQGQFVWHARGRGLETTIEPDGATLLDVSPADARRMGLTDRAAGSHHEPVRNGSPSGEHHGDRQHRRSVRHVSGAGHLAQLGDRPSSRRVGRHPGVQGDRVRLDDLGDRGAAEPPEATPRRK